MISDSEIIISFLLFKNYRLLTGIHDYSQIRSILEVLLRRVGEEEVRQRMPEEDLPLLTNILRMERRKENAKNRAVGFLSPIILHYHYILTLSNTIGGGRRD